MNSWETLLVERVGRVSRITVNRPKKLNALNRQVLTELGQVIRELSESSEPTRAAILTGSGSKAFVAGADIEELSTLAPAAAQAFSALGHQVFRQLEDAPFPVIAAINGFALGGGCELALACDLIYAAESARFGQPEVNLGLIPGFGGTFRLAERLGPGKAKEWLFTGDRIGASEAQALGLVDRVVADAELAGAVQELATRIAAKAPLAVSAAKRTVNRALRLDRLAAAALEAEAFGGIFGTEDMREGTRAFLEQRQPVFQSR